MSTLEKTFLLEIFERSLKNWDGITTRKMFGFPCAFCNNQMFLYVYHDGLVLRLRESDRLSVLEQGASPFAPKGGRGMREYVVMPDNIVTDDAELEKWLTKSLEFIQTLPAKSKKAT